MTYRRAAGELIIVSLPGPPARFSRSEMEVEKMSTHRRRSAPRLILAAALSLGLAGTTTLALQAAPAIARAHAAGKKKPKKKTPAKGFSVKVKSGTVTLAFSSTAWSRISGGSSVVGTQTTPKAPATSTGTGTFTFPIAGGTLNSATGHGTVSASGAITIESHLSIGGLFESSSSATAEAPAVTLGTSSFIFFNSSNFTPSRVSLLTLSLSHVKAIGSKTAVTLNKIPASLTAAGVQFFGSSFKTGETIATVTIAAKG